MRTLLRRLGYLLRRRQLDADLAEEIEIHRAMVQKQLERSGMAPDDAAAASTRTLGNVTLAREDARAVLVWPWLESIGQDLRIGMRWLVRQPAFTAVAVMTLALGIGANTAVFSLLDASLFRRLHARHPEELVFPFEHGATGRGENRFTFQTFERLRAANTSLADLVAYDPSRFSITVDAEAEMRRGEFVTGSYFEMMGVRSLAGRFFTMADDAPGKDPVAVISYRYWSSRFNRDYAAVGKTITVGKTPVTVIGVTPPAFQGRELTSAWADIMLPMFLQRQLGLRDHTTFSLIGRLKPGTTADQAAQDLTTIRRQELAETGGANDEARAREIRLRSAEHGELPRLGPERPNDTKQTRLITSAILIVLLVACVNIACLLLARSASRQKEMALRLAIGASRARLIRQLLTESILLSILGGLAGLLFLGWTTSALMSVLPVSELPFDARQDYRTLMFAFGVSIGTGILFGLVPAFTASRVELQPVIQGNPIRGASRGWMAKSLVAAQVALTLALLVGAGLILRSLDRLYRVEFGFSADRVMTAWIYPTLLGFDYDREMRLYRELVDTLSSTPGITAASVSRMSINRGSFNLIGPGFFETVGIPIVEGRGFSISDTATSQRVGIISESVAGKYFGHESPIGRLMTPDVDQRFSAPTEIIGVVKEIRTGYRQQTFTPAVYAPYTQARRTALGQIIVYVRTSADPSAALPIVREAVKRVEPNLALFDVNTLAGQLDQSIGTERSTAMLLGCFGGLALILASIGLFGTMAHSVTSRTRELGIRMSLGADRRSVRRMVLREALIVVAAGLAVGVPLSVLGTRLVSNLLFGVVNTDPPTMAAAIGVLLVVILVAAYLPARRASLIDPMVALRTE